MSYYSSGESKLGFSLSGGCLSKKDSFWLQFSGSGIEAFPRSYYQPRYIFA